MDPSVYSSPSVLHFFAKLGVAVGDCHSRRVLARVSKIRKNLMDPFFSPAVGVLVAGWDRTKDSDARRLALKVFVASYAAVTGSGSGLETPSWSQTRSRSALRGWASLYRVERKSKQRDPKKWGPVLWQFLRSTALKFTFAGKASFWQFLKNLGPLLPCPKCRANYGDLLSLERWARVSSAQECLSYVDWMRATVSSR
jgi:hypothetical protein